MLAPNILLPFQNTTKLGDVSKTQKSLQNFCWQDLIYIKEPELNSEVHPFCTPSLTSNLLHKKTLQHVPSIFNICHPKLDSSCLIWCNISNRLKACYKRKKTTPMPMFKQRVLRHLRVHDEICRQFCCWFCCFVSVRCDISFISYDPLGKKSHIPAGQKPGKSSTQKCPRKYRGFLGYFPHGKCGLSTTIRNLPMCTKP